MTNGEIIKGLFPEVKVNINGFLVECDLKEFGFVTPLTWWNEEYKDVFGFVKGIKSFKEKKGDE